MRGRSRGRDGFAWALIALVAVACEGGSDDGTRREPLLIAPGFVDPEVWDSCGWGALFAGVGADCGWPREPGESLCRLEYCQDMANNVLEECSAGGYENFFCGRRPTSTSYTRSIGEWTSRPVVTQTAYQFSRTGSRDYPGACQREQEGEIRPTLYQSATDPARVMGIWRGNDPAPGRYDAVAMPGEACCYCADSSVSREVVATSAAYVCPWVDVPAGCVLDAEPLRNAGPYTGAPPQECEGDPVDLESGAYVDRVGCIANESGGLAIDGSLYFDSELHQNGLAIGPLPAGWITTYARRARFVDGTSPAIHVYTEAGRVIRLEQQPDGRFVQPGATDGWGIAERDATSGAITLRYGDGSHDEYDEQGVLVAVEDGFGRRIEIRFEAIPGDSEGFLQILENVDTGQALEREIRHFVVPTGLGPRHHWLLVETRDAAGNRPADATSPLRVVRVEYDTRWARPAITRIVHQPGTAEERVVRFGYDSLVSPITERCDEEGRCVTTTYRGARVHRQVQPNGVELELEWSWRPVQRDATSYDLEVRYRDPAREGDAHFRRYLHDGRQIVRRYSIDSTTEFESMVYDAVTGVLREHVDATGRRTSFSYDERERLVEAVRDPGGSAETRVRFGDYDAFERPRRIEDGAGSVAERVYDPETGALIEERRLDPEGEPAITRYTWDARGLVESVRGPDGAVTRYERDALGHVVRVIHDAEGAALVETFDVDWRGLTTRHVDVRGVETVYERDAHGEVTAFVIDPAGRALRTELERDRLGHVTARIEDANGEAARYETTWDIVGTMGDAPIAMRDPLGRVVTYEHDSLGRVVAVREPGVLEGGGERVTRMRYEPTLAGWRIVTIAHDGREVLAQEIDRAGRLLSASDARGVLTRFEHDGAGRLAARVVGDQEIVEDGRTWPAISARWQYQYDGADRVIALDGPEGASARWSYDALGRVREAIDGEGRTTRYAYSLTERRVTVVHGADVPAASVRVDRFLDGLGRPVREVRDPDGLALTQRWSYTPDEGTNRWNLARSIDEEGAVTRFVWSSEGTLARVVDAEGNAWAYDYDRRLRLSERRDPLGRAQRYGYDAVGRRTSLTDETSAGTRTERELYAIDGLPLAHVAFDGTETRHRYDDTGRLVAIDEDAGRSPGDDVTIRWSTNDRMLSMSDALGTTSYAYDAADRLALRTRDGRTVAYAYDARNALSGIEYWGRGAVAHRSDGSGRTLELDAWGSGATLFARRATGALDRIAHPSGLGVQWSDFDGAGRPLALDHDAPDGGALAREQWTFDATSRVRTVEDELGAWSIENDALYRTTRVSGPTGVRDHAYDAVSNRLDGPIDGFDRLASLPYDARGNLLSDGTTSFAYDARDRLVRSERPGLTVEYGYDGLGRLVRMTVNGERIDLVVDERGEITRVLGAVRDDGREEHYAWSEAGLVATRRVSASGDEVLRPRLDRRGSVRALMRASGEVVERYAYDAWGAPLEQDGGVCEGARVELTASRAFRPAASYVFDEETLASEATFAVPGVVRTTEGATGNQWARLLFTEASGAQISCCYQGNRFGPTSAPDGTELARDSAWVLRSCHDGRVTCHDSPRIARRADLAAGSNVRAITTRLDVNGDRSADRTAATVVLSEASASCEPTGAALPQPPALGPGFSGEWQSPDGLVHLRARVYHPRLGRFLQRDTFDGFASRAPSQNRYLYGDADPMNRIDPTGRWAVWLIPLAVGAGVGLLTDLSPANAPTSARDCRVKTHDPFDPRIDIPLAIADYGVPDPRDLWRAGTRGMDDLGRMRNMIPDGPPTSRIMPDGGGPPIPPPLRRVPAADQRLAPGVSPDNFRSSQDGYLDESYVQELTEQYRNGDTMWLESIEVTRDGTIVDGHHRYEAMRRAGVEIDYTVVE